MPSAVPAVGLSDSGTAAIETQQTKAVSQQAHDASPAAFEKVPPQLGVAPRQTNGLEDHPVAKEVADGIAATVDALTGPGDGVFLTGRDEGGKGLPWGIPLLGATLQWPALVMDKQPLMEAQP